MTVADGYRGEVTRQGSVTVIVAGERQRASVWQESQTVTTGCHLRASSSVIPRAVSFRHSGDSHGMLTCPCDYPAVRCISGVARSPDVRR